MEFFIGPSTIAARPRQGCRRKFSMAAKRSRRTASSRRRSSLKRKPFDMALIQRGARHAGMDVRITEPDASPLQVQGPKSKALMADLFGDKVTSLAYYFFTPIDLDGIPLLVTRTGWTAEIGYELYLLDASRGPDLWNAVMKAGKPYNIRPTGPSDIRRIEAGILNYGAGRTLEENPYEVDLGRLVV